MIPEEDRPKPKPGKTWQEQKAALKHYVRMTGGEITTITKEQAIAEREEDRRRGNK